jgi:pimeloyl-ACP methyl ester carboxylesterase
MILAHRIRQSMTLLVGLALVCVFPRHLLGAPPTPGPTPAAALAAPSMSSIVLTSHGARMNGLIYRAAGEGPHPVALFLHGFPGYEKNLDLAQAVRRAGWDAVYFDYRGSWGSGGTFSFNNSIGDVATALAWIRTPANASAHHLDPSRIALVGHSFGGWLALLTARREPATVCVAAIAAWNIGWGARRLADHPDERAATVEDFRDNTDPAGGPLRSTAEALLQEMTTAPVDWDYLSRVDALKGRDLLLIAASRDTPDEDPAMHERLAAAVRAAGGSQVQSVTFEDDHSFSATRLRLGELLVQWLNTDCAKSQLPSTH